MQVFLMLPMKREPHIRRVLMFSTAIVCLLGMSMIFLQPAYAYSDPGSGLLAVQILGATLSAIGFYLRHKIRLFVARWKNLSNNTGHSTEAGDAHIAAGPFQKEK